jgi:3-oxoadipate enol-lactonase
MPTHKINGVNLFYEQYGNIDAKETIVFLNGVMASASSWKLQVELFENHGFNILVSDFRGQLRSEKPKGPYTFKMHAHDTVQLMKTCGISKAHLIGTSYGGEVALSIAIHFPEVVKSVTIINSVSELDDALIHSVLEWKRLAQTYDGELFFRGMLESVYHPSYLKANEALLEVRAKQFAALPKDYFDGQIALYDTFTQDLHLTPYLRSINVPVLIVAGENDELKPRHFSDIIAKEIPHAHYVIIPQCGHVTIFEKPETLNPLLLGFILNQMTL